MLYRIRSNANEAVSEGQDFIDGTCEEIQSTPQHLRGTFHATPRPEDIFAKTIEEEHVH